MGVNILSCHPMETMEATTWPVVTIAWPVVAISWPFEAISWPLVPVPPVAGPPVVGAGQGEAAHPREH